MALFTDEKYPEGEAQQVIPYYKGLLSTYAEWHATVTGFQDGLSELSGRNGNDGVKLPTKDARKEPHMYDLGYSLGTLTRYAVILKLATYL